MSQSCVRLQCHCNGLDNCVSLPRNVSSYCSLTWVCLPRTVTFLIIVYQKAAGARFCHISLSSPIFSCLNSATITALLLLLFYFTKICFCTSFHYVCTLNNPVSSSSTQESQSHCVLGLFPFYFLPLWFHLTSMQYNGSTKFFFSEFTAKSIPQ